MNTNRLPGHGLLDEGRSYGVGHWRQQHGPGRCSCGATSPSLDSDAQRKQWHREHKAAIREQASA